MARGRKKAETQDTGAQLGIEAELFKAADKLRGNMEPSDYKHVALGLIFLKYISDAFESKHTEILASEYPEDAEDRDMYTAENIFWVPQEARWAYLKDNAKLPTIGTLIDDAMRAIEKDNESLKGVLPKDYARPALNKIMLGELIDLFSNINLNGNGDSSKDVLGVCTNTFLGSLPERKANGVGSSTRPVPLCVCWWRCSNPIPGGFMIPAAVPAACLSSRKRSCVSTADALATSRCTGRSRTTQHGVLPR